MAVGYSMGGAVAHLVWRRHRRRVCGLVLCATSRSSGAGSPMATLVERFQDSPWLDWAAAELGRAHPAHMLSGASALGRFFIGVVDRRDRRARIGGGHDHRCARARQRALAAAIPGARTFEVDADHGAPVTRPDLFVPALVAACRSVTARTHCQD